MNHIHIFHLDIDQHDVVDTDNMELLITYCEKFPHLEKTLVLMDGNATLIPEMPQAYTYDSNTILISENCIDNAFVLEHELGHIALGHIAAALAAGGEDEIVSNLEWELAADRYAVEHSSKDLALETLNILKDITLTNEYISQEERDTILPMLDARIQNVINM